MMGHGIDGCATCGIALEKWARDVEPRLLSGADAARQLRQVAGWRRSARRSRPASRAASTSRTSGNRVATRPRRTSWPARPAPASTRRSRSSRPPNASKRSPATAEAFTTGRVTQAQVNEIAPAAIAAPDREGELLGVADERHQALLRDTCRRVTAAATDTLERHNRAHARGRCGPGPTPAAPGTSMPTGPRPTARGSWPASTPRPSRSSRKPAAANARESVDAYRFDALVRIAESSGDTAARAKAARVRERRRRQAHRRRRRRRARARSKASARSPSRPPGTLMGDALPHDPGEEGCRRHHHRPRRHQGDARERAPRGARPRSRMRRRGLLGPDREVHHLTWRSDGGEHSTTNCVGVCSWCHDLVHYHHYTLEPNGDGTYHLRAPPK